MNRVLYAWVGLVIFLIGCSSAGDVPAVAPTAPPSAAVPTDTPLPTPTFTPATTATVAPAIPKINFPADGWTDGDSYLSWLGELPYTVTCIPEFQLSGNFTCFSKTPDYQVITEVLLETFPGEQLVIDLYSPRQVSDYVDEMFCNPPIRHYPNGSCQVITSAGTITFTP